MSRHDRPNYEDVRWSHPAAAGAIAALRRTAEAIEAGLSELGRATVLATDTWRGGHRLSFDQRRRSLDEAARRLSADCRNAAAAIASADQRAREEQARRERAREEWERSERERQNHAQPRV